MVKKKKKAAKASAEEVPSAPSDEPPKLKKKRPKAVAAEAEDVAAEPADSAAAAPAPAAKRRKRPRGAEAKDEAGDAAPAVAAAAPAPAKRRKADAAAAAKGAPAADESGPAESGAGARYDTACTIFVDGVPYVWTPAKIEEFFSECGEVRDVRAPTWQDSGRLRGFAHVTFATPAARKKALGMDGVQVGKKARYLKIEPAKATEAAAAAPSVDLEGKRRLFVKNLPYDATEAEIADLFSACGKVREVRVPTSFGRSKGFAYVEFAQAAALKAVFELQPPPQLRGRVLRLDADAGMGPRAGFHYRPEAYESGFGPNKKKQRPGDGGQGGKKLSLF